MGNAFVAGLKNEAPRGGDITDEDRRQRCTKRDAEGSELSYTTTQVRACAKRAAIIGSNTVIWVITYFL